MKRTSLFLSSVLLQSQGHFQNMFIIIFHLIYDFESHKTNQKNIKFNVLNGQNNIVELLILIKVKIFSYFS